MTNMFMGAELIFEYPAWFILVCLLIAGALSYLLYRKTEISEDVSKNSIRLLFGLRFTLIFLLSLFLLSPLLKHIVTEVEKPIIVVAKDNSESIQLASDSLTIKGIEETFNQTINKLSENFEIRELYFGDKVKEVRSGYNDQTTNISELFDEVENRFSNRNVGALIVSTDGIYNTGRNPIYSGSNIKYPVYFLAIGDTSTNIDVSIAKVNHNKLAFLGNQFPVEIDLSAVKAKGNQLKVEIFNQGRSVFNQLVEPKSNKFYSTVSTLLGADKVGLQRYSVKVTQVEGEKNIENNDYDFYIEILEGRQKILILTQAVHPDIAAIKNAISKNDNYELKVEIADNFNENLEQYNLVIIHQLNDKTMPHTKYCMQNSIPMWVLHGVNSSAQYFKEFNLGVSVNSRSNSVSEVQGFVNKGFSLFQVSDQLTSLLKQLPPLKAPFGDYQASEGVQVLMSQKIGAVETDNPMLYFSTNGDQKFGVLIGEGIWRWRLVEYSLNNETKMMDQLIHKTIQYLAVKDDKKRLRLNYDKQFLSNTPVVIAAELYNKAYEKINDPEINVVIANEEGEEFSFSFGKTTSSYNLNAGSLPVGSYTFKVITNVGGEVLEENGQFIVKAVQLEALNLKADHQLLNSIAMQTNGKLYDPNTIEQLFDEIVNHNEIKPISYSHQKLSDLINLKWIFFVLLALVSLEWFIRKRNGAY